MSWKTLVLTSESFTDAHVGLHGVGLIFEGLGMRGHEEEHGVNSDAYIPESITELVLVISENGTRAR